MSSKFQKSAGAPHRRYGADGRLWQERRCDFPSRKEGRGERSCRADDFRKDKAIAEEGFIYGLPLVMNYAVMQEFAVDTKSGQFKAPFNEINNQHRVATPRTRRSSHRTATHLTRCCGLTYVRNR